MADYGGVVPNDFDALLALPGVGRKTANVVLATAFGRPASQSIPTWAGSRGGWVSAVRTILTEWKTISNPSSLRTPGYSFIAP